MRRTRLLFLGVAAGLNALAQGLANSQFTINHLPCGSQHDASVESVLKTVGVTKTGSVATLELRNDSGKTITAYAVDYTLTRGGRTDHYGTVGEEFLYQMALARHAFAPGAVHKLEIAGGKVPGRYDVYPCLAAFDDGTFVGLALAARGLENMRSSSADQFGALIRDLQSALDSTDPKAVLASRIRAGKKTRAWTSGYLDTVAADLSGAPALDKKVLTDHISALRAQQQMLMDQSHLVPASR